MGKITVPLNFTWKIIKDFFKILSDNNFVGGVVGEFVSDSIIEPLVNKLKYSIGNAKRKSEIEKAIKDASGIPWGKKDLEELTKQINDNFMDLYRPKEIEKCLNKVSIFRSLKESNDEEERNVAACLLECVQAIVKQIQAKEFAKYKITEQNFLKFIKNFFKEEFDKNEEKLDELKDIIISQANGKATYFTIDQCNNPVVSKLNLTKLICPDCGYSGQYLVFDDKSHKIYCPSCKTTHYIFDCCDDKKIEEMFKTSFNYYLKLDTKMNEVRDDYSKLDAKMDKYHDFYSNFLIEQLSKGIPNEQIEQNLTKLLEDNAKNGQKLDTMLYQQKMVAEMIHKYQSCTNQIKGLVQRAIDVGEQNLEVGEKALKAIKEVKNQEEEHFRYLVSNSPNNNDSQTIKYYCPICGCYHSVTTNSENYICQACGFSITAKDLNNCQNKNTNYFNFREELLKKMYWYNYYSANNLECVEYHQSEMIFIDIKNKDHQLDNGYICMNDTQLKEGVQTVYIDNCEKFQEVSEFDTVKNPFIHFRNSHKIIFLQGIPKNYKAYHERIESMKNGKVIIIAITNGEKKIIYDPNGQKKKKKEVAYNS